jgi:alpha-L-arabinofuranosidase
LQICSQDALDAIEFITGPEDSIWGAVRASMGHVHPWNLTYIGIGNEAGLSPSSSIQKFLHQVFVPN